jgi:hypothetical protein
VTERVTLSPEELDTLISLLFSPLMAMASLTTFIVGLNAFAVMVRLAGQAGVEQRMAAAINYGIARAFVVSLFPGVLLIWSTIEVYT